VKIKIPNFFGLSRFHIQFGACLRKFGGLSPLVWEEIENEQTVHKPKLKFIYRRYNDVFEGKNDFEGQMGKLVYRQRQETLDLRYLCYYVTI
jgi:hypothetical protein